MRKKIYGLAAALVLSAGMLLCSGCGDNAKDAETTGIWLGKDGQITGSIVEEFDREYYSVEGLNSMIQEEINQFGQDAEAVSLVSVEAPEELAGKIRVVMEYRSWEEYAAFNEVACFYGTVEEARTAGYDFTGNIVSTSDGGKVLSADELAALSENRVLVLGESLLVNLPAKAQYFSAGCELVNSKCVNVLQTDGLTYIIMK